MKTRPLIYALGLMLLSAILWAQSSLWEGHQTFSELSLWTGTNHWVTAYLSNANGEGPDTNGETRIHAKISDFSVESTEEPIVTQDTNSVWTIRFFEPVEQPDVKKPIVLESAKSKTNDLCVFVVDGKTVLRVDFKNQVFVHGQLVGQITTNSWVPFPMDGVPTFQDGVQLGIAAAWRNPDVRDIRALMPAAVALWNASHQPQKP